MKEVGVDRVDPCFKFMQVDSGGCHVDDSFVDCSGGFECGNTEE